MCATKAAFDSKIVNSASSSLMKHAPLFKLRSLPTGGFIYFGIFIVNILLLNWGISNVGGGKQSSFFFPRYSLALQVTVIAYGWRVRNHYLIGFEGYFLFVYVATVMAWLPGDQGLRHVGVGCFDEQIFIAFIGNYSD
ncbi:hypothetical protein CEXT_640761 [Caerostris extrusa]|uniref:Uncharacterized protein n=1 Tax=Caerostris extrusa TaxID=172846 RepID=A0AAV4MW93_CAEEX|nr:hypothetical protein CEXT_640761 [Caerostris extrusa]